jgi:hypothetical protein
MLDLERCFSDSGLAMPELTLLCRGAGGPKTWVEHVGKKHRKNGDDMEKNMAKIWKSRLLELDP